MFNSLFYSWSKFSIPRHASLLPEFHTKSPLKGYMVNVYQNLSQTAVGNSKYLFFLLEMYEMYARIYDKKIPIILSKLIYKDKSWLKELWKISRCFRSHIMSLHESSQSITGNSPQTTRWSSYWCWVLLKVLPWLSKWKPKGE